ncbi:L-rhamnose mutarotase [Joostella atrarenae]|nr:L-rhamnose mutarotase [Joostella atrarenae]
MACDLKQDQQLIEKYKEYHAAGNAWPEITKSIKEAGILDMEIYLTGNRLFMVMEVNETFDFDTKAYMDANNKKVQEWESLMQNFQQELPWAPKGIKWLPTEQIFKLE